jgi:hypothetical protein
MTRVERILNAIANALQATPGSVAVILLLVAGGAVLLVSVAMVQRMLQRRRLNKALRKRFDHEIRILDLTINQLDMIELLRRFLRDRHKAYLLLTNRDTFLHCRRALGKVTPQQETVLNTLSAKLGFDTAERIALDLGEYLPRPGVVVKIEEPGNLPRVLARVVSAHERKLIVACDEKQPLTRAASVVVYASHPSGIMVAEGEVVSADPPDVEIHLSRPFAEPEARQLADNTLRVFVRAEAKRDEPQPAEVRALWPSGALLSNPDCRFRPDDDIQIVFRRNHAAWVVVNAEVVGLRSRRRLMRVRFSHLIPEARREILGSTR